jgi:hypothetical protein
MQVGERAGDLLQDAVQLFLGNRRVAAQGLEERALAIELLQQVALQVRPARHLEDLEHPVRHAWWPCGSCSPRKKLTRS